MMKFNKGIVGGILVVSILIVAGFFIFYSSSETPPDKLDSTITELSVPNGWYLHRLSDTSLLLTRQETLPNIGNTELYAYGEQISFNKIPIDISPEEWAAQKTYIDLDDVLVLKSEWSEVNGYKLLSVEREAAGASGKVMDRYLFTKNVVYIFSLYPLESYDFINREQRRNTENVDVLEQILQDYVTQL